MDVGSPLGGKDLMYKTPVRSSNSQNYRARQCQCQPRVRAPAYLSFLPLVQFHISQRLLGLQATPVFSHGPALHIHCSVDQYAKDSLTLKNVAKALHCPLCQLGPMNHEGCPSTFPVQRTLKSQLLQSWQ